MTDDAYDEFVTDAASAAHSLWREAGGGELDGDRLDDLEDAIRDVFDPYRTDLEEDDEDD